MAHSAPKAPAKKAHPQNVDAVVRSILIPPCPATLMALQKEIGSSNPDARAVAQLVMEDVSLSLTVLRTVNAPFYGLRRHVESISQAVAFIGLKPLATLVTSTLIREAVSAPGLDLAQFWEMSNHRSYAMRTLAQRVKGADVDAAQAFGLFCDIGIPLLMGKFPGYEDTLKLAFNDAERPFTAVEQAHHHADHTQIGAIMARTWGLSDTLYKAIKLDHDFTVFHDTSVPESVCQLIAMSLVADMAISELSPANANQEWSKGGADAKHYLMLSDYDMADWMEALREGFFAVER